jgi:hypothetical protein
MVLLIGLLRCCTVVDILFLVIEDEVCVSIIQRDIPTAFHFGLVILGNELEEFTGLRRTPPAAALAMRYPYLSNAPVLDTYYNATEIQIWGILV